MSSTLDSFIESINGHFDLKDTEVTMTKDHGAYEKTVKASSLTNVQLDIVKILNVLAIRGHFDIEKIPSYLWGFIMDGQAADVLFTNFFEYADSDGAQVPSDVMDYVRAMSVRIGRMMLLGQINNSPKPKLDTPSEPSLKDGFWENAISEVEILLVPYDVYGDLGVAGVYQDEMKGLVVAYRRSVGDIPQKQRGMMSLLAYLSGFSDSIHVIYDNLRALLCFNKGNSTPEIYKCHEDGVSINTMEMAHERYRNTLPDLDNEIIKGNQKINEVLKGAFGAGLQKEIEKRMHVGGAIFSQSDTSDSRIFTSNSTPSNLLIGTFIDDESTLYFDNEKSLITIAPPGSGKTQCHVLPTLNNYKGAAIVLDIKGECFQKSGVWRKENVGRVLVFNPQYPDHSNKYNPLSFISQDPDEVWEESRFLAELLIVPKSQSDPVWETQGRQLLTLIISYIAYLPEKQRNMTKVLDFLSEIGLVELFDDVLVEGAPFPSSMRRTANKFKQMKEASEKQFQGVLSGANQHLTIWEGSVVERLTKSSDWSPMDFRSEPPMTLYLCIPPNAIETYAPLLRVIIAQHVRHLMKEEPSNDAPEILFMLDELPRLGKMEPIREALEVGRSYKIRLWMFAQYVAQLQEAYGKDIADGMIEACGARMYMNAGADIAEKLSKIMGTRENIMTGKTEPVVTPQDLMGPEWRDDILVFATGEKPMRLKKSFFHAQEQGAE